jgi:hypothetical protein
MLNKLKNISVIRKDRKICGDPGIKPGSNPRFFK